MTVTAEHTNRIADFILARIDEQMTGDHASRAWDEDPVSRSLRALRRAVEDARARARATTHDPAPDLELTDKLTMVYAWGELSSVSKEWRDHSDYLPEFELMAHQLGQAESTVAP